MRLRSKGVRSRWTALLIALICSLCAVSCGSRTPAVAGPRVIDDFGNLCTPLALGGARAAVLIFAGIECPISNGYAPQINQLCEEYAKQQVNFYIVYPDSDLSVEAARAHAKAYQISCPVLLDRAHALTRVLGATVTPEAVVAGPGGKVLYRGRIDDLYVTLGHRRYEARSHDLKDALDAVLAGRPVTNPSTQAIGCSINT